MLHGYAWMGNYSWIGIVLNVIVLLAVIALVVWLVIWAVRQGKSRGFAIPPQMGPTPKEIVQIRYAKGEITQVEYRKMITDLEK